MGMAQILNDFDFSSEAAAGGRARHPWGEWLDGQIRVLTKGEDFTGQAKNMETQLKTQAKLRGRVALVKLVVPDPSEGPTTITVQAVNADLTKIETPSVVPAVKPAKKAKAADADADAEATEAAEDAADAAEGADASE